MRQSASILPLEVSGLGYRVDGRWLVEDVTCRIEPGRRTVILGPNGSGKTLFLKLCHGLIQPSAGTVRFGEGDAPGGAVAGRKRHAMVAQHPVMLRRTVTADVAVALAAARGYGFFEARRRAREALDRFGLAEFAGRPARVLSGGEKQRVAIARAAATDSEILFLDEPSSALDPTATRHVEDMLLALARAGQTLVMTTHDLGQARRLAEHVLFFHRGRLIEAGPAEAFFGVPRTDEARAFLEGGLLW